MPVYEYLDKEGHTQTVTHRMLFTTGIVCAACGLPMWRKPAAFYVSWGGLKPSAGELSPAVKTMVGEAERRRGEYYKGYNGLLEGAVT